jgi:hypothetical protein
MQKFAFAAVIWPLEDVTIVRWVGKVEHLAISMAQVTIDEYCH